MILYTVGLFLLTSVHNVSAQYANDPFQFADTLGKYVTPGVLFGDYDDDGDIDLYLANGTQGYEWQGFLYQNDGNGDFSRITGVGSITSDQFTSGGGAWGDADGDGDLDLIVANPFTRGSFPTNYSEVSLYINNGDGTFSDAPSSDLVAEESSRSKIAAAWADYDNDDDIDVFVSNATFLGAGENHALYQNNGSLNFDEVSNTMTNNGSSARGGFSWADYDNDGDQDIVTVSGAPGQETVLWINEGSDFRKYLLIASGETEGISSEGASWGDYDNDGDPDLFIANGGEIESPEENILYRNDGVDGNGDPIFTKLDSTSGVGPITDDNDLSLASAWGDYNNDGYLDLFVGNDGDYDSGYRSRLYINNADGTFSKETSTILVDSADFARGAAWADVDSDGNLDIMVGREGQNRLFKNNGSDNNFLNVQLTGNTSNTAAIGAIVRVKANIDGQNMWQMRDVSAQTGYGSHNSFRLHFGLGDATNVDSLKIEWPGTGNVDVYTDVAANQFVSYSEQTSTNTPPEANDDSADTDEDSSVTIDVLANDSDPDGDELTVFDVTQPSNGTVNINVDSTVTYTPDADFYGSDAFDYVASDGNGGKDTATVSVEVYSVNDPPEIQNLPQEKTLNTNDSTKMEMSQYAYDVDTPDSLLVWSFSVSDDEAIGYAFDGETDTLTIYSYDKPGDYQLFTTLTDDSGASDNDTIQIHVEDPSSLAGQRSGIPESFEVYPNYPNPFNPNTRIRFGLPSVSEVFIEIYDITGKRVRRYELGIKSAGYHNFQIKASRYSSGVYFYRVKADQWSQVKKMMLVK